VSLHPRAVRAFKEKRCKEETSIVGSVVRVMPDTSATTPSLYATYAFGKATAAVATKDRGLGADGTHRCGLQTSGAQARMSRSSNSRGSDAS
jgi:hypothetical protein